jgi:hypothetical protein
MSFRFLYKILLAFAEQEKEHGDFVLAIVIVQMKNLLWKIISLDKKEKD